MKEISTTQSLAKSVKLREQGGWLTIQAYLQRKSWMTAKDSGVLCQKVESRSLQETMATDPSVMVNAVKSQLTGLIPQIMIGAWVNFFFAGFVLGKVPFSLSPRFRPMLQVSNLTLSKRVRSHTIKKSENSHYSKSVTSSDTESYNLTLLESVRFCVISLFCK